MAKTERLRRTEQELQAAVIHLAYEFEEFVLDGLRWRTGDNAYLEAHLLHARTLIEFLIGRDKGPHINDMTPADFTSGWVTPDVPATMRLTDSLPNIDQHLSHLSWSRVTWALNNSNAKEWDYVEIINDMYGLYGQFVALAQEQGAAGSTYLVTRLETLKALVARTISQPPTR